MPTLEPLPSLAPLARSNFAPDFRWGSSTSAFQIEGAHQTDGRGESIWDRFCATPGTVRDGATGAVACDHYHLWPTDLDLARNLGTNAYRFSIAWPRIFPDGRGVRPNQRGLDFYSRLVDGMLARGLEPWATLYHWDLPQTLQNEGGWANRDCVEAFEAYTDAVSRVLGDRVKKWITHNEPWCTAIMGNYEGVHAPGLRDLKTALQVCHHVLLSHGRVVPVLRANAADARVGIALSLHPLRAASALPEDAAAMRRHDGIRNRWFLDPLFGRSYPTDTWTAFGDLTPAVVDGDLAAIAVPTDFLGINYYFPEIVAHAPGVGVLQTRLANPDNVERTAFGWEVSPQGLVTLLKRVSEEYGPNAIYITENGSTYDDVLTSSGEINDVERRRYLAQHIAATHDAIRQGVPVKGYFAWSLLDNFEWAEGYTRRFGLVHVNFATQKRTLKASGKWFAEFLQGHTFAATGQIASARSANA